MTTAWSIHQPVLNFMKYLSISPPEKMAERVDSGDPRAVHHPPAGRQKGNLPPEFLKVHMVLLSLRMTYSGSIRLSKAYHIHEGNQGGPHCRF
jgi:hypothetical protein